MSFNLNRCLAGTGLRTEDLPPEVRIEAEKTIGDEYRWNSDVEALRWQFVEMPIDDATAYLDEQIEEHQIKRLAADIRKNGVRLPVVFGPCGVEGQHRIQAAKLAGLTTIPVYSVIETEVDEDV